MPDNSNGYSGAQDNHSSTSELNAITFVVNQILAGRNVATLVKVKAVTNSGGLSPVGFVSLQPMVSQLDGNNNAVPHGVVHNIPYFRIQGGSDAIIIDPKLEDIGLAVFADRDISAVKASGAISNPGSMRRSDKADGLYFGGFLNGIPTQYVQFSSAGIKLHSPIAVVLDAPDVQISAQTVEIVASTSTTVTTPTFTVNGATVLNGTLAQGTGAGGGGATMLGPINVTNDVVAAGKSVSGHIHHENGAGNNTNPPT
ncbi:MAG: oxidoreductase [Herbaspirillum sp.]|nr:oxidoreductase [Herbaspirillum sp.]